MSINWLSAYIKRFLIKQKIRNKKIIVSMTSYPKRIDKIAPAIESVLNQTLKPDKIILWLAKSEFIDTDLPKYLTDLVKNKKIIIEWNDDLKPHKKYFYAFKKYSDDIIITFDDDLIYENDIIECLIDSYIKYPYAVSAMRTHIMKRNEDKFDEYNNFKREQNKIINKPSMQLLATNGAGTLFPPNILNLDYLDEKLISKLCLLSDDLFLKILQVISDVPVIQPRKFDKLNFIPETQEDSLWKINKLPQGNDKTMENLRKWSDENFYKGFLISKIFATKQKNKKTILYFAPHQDDELLTMGIDICNSIQQGVDVHVILCVNGSKSGVKKVLNNGKTCKFHSGKHEYNLNPYEFVNARDREFIESCANLGVPLANIHLYYKRPCDNELTQKITTEIIKKYLSLYDKKATVCTIWYKNGKSQHKDHKTLGLTVHKLFKKRKLKSVRFFKEPYCQSKTRFNKFHAANYTETKINRAINSYSKWEPKALRYAIGYHSVKKSFDDFKKEMNVYYFDLEQ